MVPVSWARFGDSYTKAAGISVSAWLQAEWLDSMRPLSRLNPRISFNDNLSVLRFATIDEARIYLVCKPVPSKRVVLLGLGESKSKDQHQLQPKDSQQIRKDTYEKVFFRAIAGC